VSAPPAAFSRGVSDGFVEALGTLAAQGGWWADVLADPTLVIGIRDEYLNVYWRGQSLFRVRFDRAARAVRTSTHPKYLLDPALAGQVELRGRDFALPQAGDGTGLLRRYEGKATLRSMKRAADLFAGDEKRGVHAITLANPNAIDVEIALPAPASPGGAKATAPRVDIAAFEEAGASVRLAFWEAKLFANPELWPDRAGETPALGQVATYRALLALHRDAVLRSYRRVAENLVAIAAMSGGARAVPDLVGRVAHGAPLTLDQPPAVGLVVFAFTAAQRDGETWRTQRKAIAEAVGPRLRERGDAADIRL